jgi:Transcription factor WhiB
VTDVASLFASAFGTVDLPNAACKGRHELFDSDLPDDIDDAIAICRRCPELSRCRDWYASLPPIKRPFGVTAGQVKFPKRKEVA